MKTFVVTALALGIAAWSSVSRPVTAAATSCEALGSIPLPNTTITVAQMVMEGTFTPPGGSVPIHVPSFVAWRPRSSLRRIPTSRPRSGCSDRVEWQVRRRWAMAGGRAS